MRLIQVCLYFTVNFQAPLSSPRRRWLQRQKLPSPGPLAVLHPLLPVVPLGGKRSNLHYPEWQCLDSLQFHSLFPFRVLTHALSAPSMSFLQVCIAEKGKKQEHLFFPPDFQPSFNCWFSFSTISAKFLQ